MAVATRPAVAAYISVPLGYLASHQVNVSVVIGDVQRALQLAISDATDGLSIPALMAAVNDVPGVSSTKYVLLDGDFVNFPAVEGAYLIDVPAEISVEAWIIE